jgi:2-amino-4-hydroxy-6-hydroxymethyldihydropteridine diphosphokinase
MDSPPPPSWDFKGDVPPGFAILALGGNLGDVSSTFRKALESLTKTGFEVLKLSSFHKTAPVGCEEGAAEFLNAVLIGLWRGDASSLLSLCKRLEAEAGRPLEHPRWVSRPLDIDIVAFGPSILATPSLTLPHPLALKRTFVLEPLCEIAPEARLPGSGSSAREALARLKPTRG